MATFNFKAPATECLHGTAYFMVEAKTEAEARKKLQADAAEYFEMFCEEHGNVEWNTEQGDDFEAI